MKIKAIEGDSHTFKGKVLITDPCYLIPNEFWADFCNEMFKLDSAGKVLFKLDNTIIFVLGTAYGDGCYPVIKNGEEIGRSAVDAGLLSVIPMAFAKKHGFDRWDLVTVIDGGETESTSKGNFKCAGLRKNTDGMKKKLIMILKLIILLLRFLFQLQLYVFCVILL